MGLLVNTQNRWSSINELRLFDLTNQAVYCVAQLPNQNPFAATSTGTPSGSSTGPSAPFNASPSVTKSSGIETRGICSIFGSTMMGAAFALMLV
jgi:hypothetical protein